MLPRGQAGHGLDQDKTAASCALAPGQVAEHAGLLVAAYWLVEARSPTGCSAGGSPSAPCRSADSCRYGLCVNSHPDQ
ncbi:hypothetical protein [Streptomyces albiaxialis]|uniref:hypothetical protein n=1 Tax=Streptomyces albiaxialis TaxID=329523 RepID=UPI0031D1573F